MSNKTLEVQELIQALLNLNQPHAKVVVRGEVTCDEEHAHCGYVDYKFCQRVVDAHSELNMVILEVEE